MIKRIILIHLGVLFSLVGFSKNSNKELGVVPQPKHIELTHASKSFVLDQKTVVSYGDGLSNIASYLGDRLSQSTGYSVRQEAKTSRVGIRLEVNRSLSDNDGAYTLVSSKKRVTIIGATPKGVFWGVQTLLQLLPPEVYSKSVVNNVDWKIPSVKIEDAPSFERFRGVHIDISRHFRTKKEILQTLDMMAMHKMNVLHLHFSDDDGWRIESKVYPKLTAVGSQGDRSSKGKGDFHFLTQEDVKEIIAYANARYIEVLPEIDMPGHMHAVVRSYPDLASDKDPRKKKKVIRIDEKGATFCRNILKEMVDLFNQPSEFHLGFDEVNLGAKIYTDEEINAFASQMAKYVKDELNTTPILWDDAFEKGIHNPDYLIQWWRFGLIAWWKTLEMPMDQKLLKLDQPFILSPGNYTYFDMSNTPKDPGARWGGAISVAQIYAWEPLLDLTNYDPSKRSLVKGIICAVWSEKIRNMDTFEERVYPRLAVMSEKCWATDGNTNDKLSWEDYRDHVLSKQLKRYDVIGVNYWSKGAPDKLKQLKSAKKVGKK
ncbi:beta-N-acetylhexosaminidase [Halosquirtibacter xylanolyticus]|uniref:beta-N-acetylhexosaminidase n=1 Tax=Halosquirtibacter xylanolyticus TaxID=3374599 RepID=UPI00374A49AD|nr:beta-N-acetylhexosaminidase [Prolixibacteraceae bacterium]